MGSLHSGHLSLCSLSLLRDDFTIASIFVNPLQFARGEDLDSYPESLEEDVRKLGERGVHAVFCPTRDELYEGGEVCSVDAAKFNEGVREVCQTPQCIMFSLSNQFLTGFIIGAFLLNTDDQYQNA